jgi:hypothetical protein
MTDAGRFIDALPSQLARDCFIAWRSARQGKMLPLLWDFAPFGLPARVLPWVLIHRQRANGDLVHGLAGDELIRWFGGNPKGKPVFGDIEAGEREKRIAQVRQSISSGMPFWFWGTLLLKNKEHVPMGRLCLPARDKAEQVVLRVYFILREAPTPQLRGADRDSLESAEIVWCSERDLVE